MQDVFYICSLHVPKIPLVFVVSLLSPQSPTYLHVTYPRWTLSVLRIQQFTAPSGLHLLEEIILGVRMTSLSIIPTDAFQTFFDASFNPDIMLGHSVLTFIIDYFERYDSSVESLIHLIRVSPRILLLRHLLTFVLACSYEAFQFRPLHVSHTSHSSCSFDDVTHST